jgi:hypothetical protein
MSEQDYNTLRARPLSELNRLPAIQVAWFLRRCTPRVRAAINQVRHRR